MDLMDLNVTISADTSGVETGISNTNTKTQTLSSSMIAFGALAANAISKVVDKMGDLLSSVVEVGMETETSFAQLETIAGTENIDALSESLSELATQTGISSSELAVTAYNAISAGTSAENAAEMVESAAKLATAGFTDTDSVLTTTINAYGLEEEEATAISDSLIQVQNLGVTTIDELASSMGKAISTASAYNVDLYNLESAYVSLTKAGISTEESTTYLSSLLNELGDSGSDVAAILQEETGVSFGSLMEQGYSLADVMDILYESVGGDSEALMNLWSSAEAGKASSAIVSQGLEEFNENLLAIQDSAGATEDAYAIMTDTMDYKVSVLKTSFEELGNSIFDELEPGLNTFIDFVTNTIVPALQEFTENIDFSGILETITSFLEDKVVPAISFLADNMDKIIPIIEGVVVALVAYKVITTAVNTVQAIMNALMNASPFGLIVTAISAIIAIITVLVTNWDKVVEVMSIVWEAIKGFFTHISEWFSGLISSIGGWFSDIWNTIVNWFTSMNEKYWEFINDIWEAISGWFLDLISGIAEWFAGIWETIVEWFTSMNEKQTEFLLGIWETVSGWFSDLISSIAEWFTNIKDNIVSAFNTVKENIVSIWTAIKTWLTDLISTIATSIKDKFTSIKDTIVSVFTTVKTKISTIWNAIWTTIKNVINKILAGVETWVNGIISAINKLLSGINKMVNAVGSAINSLFGTSIGEISLQLNTVSLPRLAAGAVIDPNDEFLAVLGDQTSGRNIETPESLLREIVAEESPEIEYTTVEGKAVDLSAEIEDVVAAQVDRLMQVFQEYFPQFANAQMYLDGDKLVSGTADRMNIALGKISVRSIRA